MTRILVLEWEAKLSLADRTIAIGDIHVEAAAAGDFMARISAARVRKTDQTNAVYTQLRNMLAGHWTTRGR